MTTGVRKQINRHLFLLTVSKKNGGATIRYVAHISQDFINSTAEKLVLILNLLKWTGAIKK